MVQSRSARATVLGLSALFLLAVVATYTLFAVFVPAANRTRIFYIVLSIVCGAELVVFAHLAHSRLARTGTPSATRPVRTQVNFLILVWFVLTLLTAAIAGNPQEGQEVNAYKVLAIYFVLTVIFFMAAYALYSKDVEVAAVDRQLAAERRSLQLNVPDIEQAMRALEELGRQHADHAVLADRVRKRMDTIRNALEGVLVSGGSLQDSRDEQVQKWTTQMEQEITQLISLCGGASRMAADQVGEALGRIANQADTILATLRRRERSALADGE